MHQNNFESFILQHQMVNINTLALLKEIKWVRKKNHRLLTNQRRFNEIHNKPALNIILLYFYKFENNKV
jgi:hypothetical protein